MSKRIALIIFMLALCLCLLWGGYRALQHREARPAVPPTAA